MTYRAVLLAVALLATVSSARAAMLCKTRAGTVKLRDACGKKETAIDLAEFRAMPPTPPTPPDTPDQLRAKFFAGTAITGPEAISSRLTTAKKGIAKKVNKQIDARLPWGTDDIADGAISGAKVQDGSITAADLAPGTVGAGTTIQSANTVDLPTGPNEGATRAPIGPSSASDPVIMLAPVDMTVGDFHALTSTEGIGQAREFRIERSSGNSLVVGCTVTSGNQACNSGETGTINAGDAWLLHVTNGPGGSSSALGVVGYTLKVK